MMGGERVRHEDEKGNCRACGRVVLWALTEGMNFMPVDPGEVDINANLVLYRGKKSNRLRVKTVKPGEGRFVTHFATCPDRHPESDRSSLAGRHPATCPLVDA